MSRVIEETAIGKLTYRLGSYEKDVHNELEKMTAVNFSERLWKGDSSLWTNHDESQFLGWLNIVDEQIKNLTNLQDYSKHIWNCGYKHAVLLGMGGSSLCVEVMRQIFGSTSEFPQMLVLDSIVPAQVMSVRKQINPASTLFIVATKSGSTTEPNVLTQYFFEETKKLLGQKAGEHFIAITDPGSFMEKQALDLKFSKIFYGIPSIGGRFSALSNFGMVPAAVMGLDLKSFLAYAQSMTQACAPAKKINENPGILLGTILGVLANKHKRDKMTFICSPGISSLGTWLEPLLAESTGKDGKGLIPVTNEKPLMPEKYGNDRLFVYMRLSNRFDKEQDKQVEMLEKTGQPVVCMNMQDTLELGAQFFCWEIATATAGALLGINAFNQPNVQESKDFTKEYLKKFVDTGNLPTNKLLFEESGMENIADEDNVKELLAKSSNKKSLSTILKAFIGQLKPGDYFAINAYIECCPYLEEKLQKIRDLVMTKLKMATTIGFGPRFLHSTGQLHKGGPHSGVFLQITSDDMKDIPIPQEKYSFAILKEAQSLGDFQALSSRKRRLLRLHLPANIDCALDELFELINAALAP